MIPCNKCIVFPVCINKHRFTCPLINKYVFPNIDFSIYFSTTTSFTNYMTLENISHLDNKLVRTIKEIQDLFEKIFYVMTFNKKGFSISNEYLMRLDYLYKDWEIKNV